MLDSIAFPQYAHTSFGVPMLDVERNGQPVAADVVTVSLFGEGTDSTGQPSYAARVVTLHGAEYPEPRPGGARPHCVA